MLRLVFALAAAYLLIIGVMNFFRYATSTTDENWFRTSPSNLYITKSFPAAARFGKNSGVVDSVLAGDFLTAVNDHKFQKGDSAGMVLAKLAADSTFELRVLRPALDKALTFKAKRSAFPDSFLVNIPPSVYIFDVIRGGASEMAGIKAGDVVFRINEEFFDDAHDADTILREAETGATISYNIIRNNRVLTIPVTLANFGISVSVLILFLAGVAYVGIGAFISLSRPEVRAAQLIGLAMMLFGLVWMVLNNQRDLTFDLFAKARNVTLLAALTLGIAFWIHSKFHFPQARPELISRPWLWRIPYLVAGVVFSTFFLNLVKTQFWIIFVGSLALTILFLLQLVIYLRFRHLRTHEYLKLRRPIFWTAWIAAGGVILIALTLILGNQLRQMGYIGIPLLFIPLAYLYTIGRYQLLGINIRMRRNIQYIIVSSIWITLLIVLALRVLVLLPQINISIPNIHFTGTSIVILDEPPPPTLRDFIEKIMLMMLAIALTITTYKIGKLGQGFIDRKFFRERQVYNRAASELAEVMTTQLNLVELCRGIVRKLARLIQLKRVGIIIYRDEKECRHHEAHGIDQAGWEEICKQASQKLVGAIQKFRSESRFSIEYLPNDLKETFLEFGLRHIIPIRFKEKLVGALLVGEKLSEVPLIIDDLTFLATIAKQSAVAVENAFLHESLAEQERLKHELELARRIQMASLPQRTPEIRGLDIAGISVPALEVGGDYFDYLNGKPDEITIIVGDVSGKGTSAALYMSKIQGILRSLNEFNLSPRELFIRANQLLAKDLDRSSFVTAIGAAIDAGQRHLILARAGHLPLFYFHGDTGKVELVVPKGLGLGLDKNETFATELEEQVIKYEPNDVFLFVTDGVTEAQTNNGLEFGEDKLTKILETCSNLHAKEIRDRVLSEVKRFAGNSLQHDDQTVVVVKAVN
ncbi:MAG TPA: SpoIIE family protein phosphatase [bacterium]